MLAPELLVWMWQWNSPILQMFMTRYFHVAIFFACACPPAALTARHSAELTGSRSLRAGS